MVVTKIAAMWIESAKAESNTEPQQASDLGLGSMCTLSIHALGRLACSRRLAIAYLRSCSCISPERDIDTGRDVCVCIYMYIYRERLRERERVARAARLPVLVPSEMIELKKWGREGCAHASEAVPHLTCTRSSMPGPVLNRIRL